MEKQIGVNGMTCQHCKKSVEDALHQLSGVRQVTVNLEEGQVTVDYDEEVVSLGDIRIQIEEQGFDIVQ